MISHTHSSGLALAAIVVSIVASITALALMKDLRMQPESKRKAIIVMSAFVMGGGIWSMHFLAMLAVNFPVPIHYDLLQTLSSGLIAILVVGFALLLLHFQTRTSTVLNIAGISLGMGIMSMHFVGMLGLRGVIPHFSAVAVIGALIVALVMGVVAIRVSYGSRSKQNIVKGGITFGLSIVVVHFSAMLGTQFSLDPDYDRLTSALDQETLAIAVTVAAFVICGSFLLAASTFLSSAEGNADNQSLNKPAKANDHTSGENSDPLHGYQAAEPAPDQAAIQSKASEQEETIPDHSSNAEHLPSASVGLSGNGETNSSAIHSAAIPGSAFDAHQPVRIPYEEHKKIQFVTSEDVATIRADGRYTQLHTRNGLKFCPWSITEAEARLKAARFYRAHRSYLINVQAVTGFEKKRDAGVCRFEGFSQLGNVPVSRTRVSDLVALLGL